MAGLRIRPERLEQGQVPFGGTRPVKPQPHALPLNRSPLIGALEQHKCPPQCTQEAVGTEYIKHKTRGHTTVEILQRAVDHGVGQATYAAHQG